MNNAIAITAGALATLLAVYLAHLLQFRREKKRDDMYLLQAFLPALESLRLELITNSERCLGVFAHLNYIMREHLDDLDSETAHHDWLDFLGATGPFQDPNWPGWELRTSAHERYLARERWLVTESEVVLSRSLQEYYGVVSELRFAAEREREFAASSREFSVGQSIENIAWLIRAVLERVAEAGPVLDMVMVETVQGVARISGSLLGRKRRVTGISEALARGDVGRREDWRAYFDEAERIRGRRSVG